MVGKLSKSLDLLKQELFDVKNEGILKYLIPVLEDFEKKIEALSKKVEELEQAKTYFPFTEEELLKEKIGGTD